MSIGENIVRIRKSKEMSQIELAKKCDMLYQTLSKYERNLLTPKLETIKKIAEALDVGVFDLIEYEKIENEILEDFSKSKKISTAENYITKHNLNNLEIKLENIGFSILIPTIDIEPSKITLITPDGKHIVFEKDDLLRLDRETNDFLLFKLENYTKNQKKDQRPK